MKLFLMYLILCSNRFRVHLCNTDIISDHNSGSVFLLFSRAITSTVDKTTNNRLHDLVLDKFGMTPYINTYPDFLAGALVMSFALLVAAGLDRSKTLQRWINCLTCSALVVVLLIGAWDSNLEIYKKQAFLFNGSHGVIFLIYSFRVS